MDLYWVWVFAALARSRKSASSSSIIAEDLVLPPPGFAQPFNICLLPPGRSPRGEGSPLVLTLYTRLIIVNSRCWYTPSTSRKDEPAMASRAPSTEFTHRARMRASEKST
ncbi:hypothetical protein FOZ60_011929 [Perkinsus olseni]|uniref:Uncharacterized protein n=1 Tax=Perkinsus olseni TaxID=32597 RepID=A0A7J6NDP1_PEROL|nr:hypothetical protein FOZ60_011929 [Perkinsus olseni]